MRDYAKPKFTRAGYPGAWPGLLQLIGRRGGEREQVNVVEPQKGVEHGPYVVEKWRKPSEMAD